MDHTGAKDLKPAGVLADAAAIAAAGYATDVDLKAGLNKGKIAGAKPSLDFLPEKLGEKLFKCGHEVGKRDVSVDVDSLDLVEEDVRSSRDVLIAEAAPGGDDPDRGGMGFHRADLDVGGVGAEQVLGIEIKGVLHVAGGMVFSEVEGFKVVKVCLDVGSELDRKTHADEDVQNSLKHRRYGVHSP